MEILKKKYWWIWLLLLMMSGGCHTVFLSILLDNFDKDAWYANWKYWIIGLVCLVLPFAIMLEVFLLQMTAQAAAKLEVPMKEIYLSPFVWILCLIIPIIGWICFTLLFLYLQIAILFGLARGYGEQYLKVDEK